MPYTNIAWIKLEKRLLNDYRFYTMPEEGQLLFVKMLMLAGETSNKIPKKMSILKSALRATQSETRLKELIDIIKINFPKFKENNHFYSFLEWNKRHNRIAPKDAPWDAPMGSSKGAIREEKIKKENIDKIRTLYMQLKGWDEQNYFGYGRDDKAIKILLLRVKNDELVEEGLKWMARQPYAWTLETLVRKWPDFMNRDKTKNQPFLTKAQQHVKQGIEDFLGDEKKGE